MKFDMRVLPRADRYKLMTAAITPRPIAWITSQSSAGVRNAAPYSFFNMMGDDPPIIAVGLLRRADASFKDSAANILETGEFVVNLVAEHDAAAMNITCMDAPPDVDEIDCAGLDVAASDLVAAPRIASAPVSFECRLTTSVSPGGRQTVVIAEVVMTHVRDEYVIDEARRHLDTLGMGLIARMHGSGWYTRCRDLLQLDRPSYAQWKATTGRG
jgi:flavin reductase (DIM6/NTAB) family NADH-FMN oxidoreductase RutF